MDHSEASETSGIKSDEPAQLLQNLCAICHVEPPKYKCPSCFSRTCSITCSKRHKELTSCTGVVDPTRYLRRSELLSDVHTLNRDYNFLQRVNRQIHVAMNDLDSKMPRAKKRGAGMNQPNAKRSRNDGGKGSGVIIKNGVNIHQLPGGMSRAMINRTGWMGKKNKFFGWTVEWVLWESADKMDSSEESKKVSHGISESTILAEAASRLISEKKEEPCRYFLLKIPGQANRPKLIELDGLKSLHDNLVDKSVIEFPTIHVVAPNLGIPKRYSLLEESSASEGDSDSDDSSSSDDDSSDSSGSEDDEPPEESTSKQVDTEVFENKEADPTCPPGQAGPTQSTGSAATEPITNPEKGISDVVEPAVPESIFPNPESLAKIRSRSRE